MNIEINLITNYFLLSCLLNDRQDKEKTLNILLDIYKVNCLDTDFIAFNQSELNDFVESIENYNIILRMQEYYKLNHTDDSKIKSKYLNIKGEALSIIKNLDLDNKTSSSTIYKKLYDLKLKGSINAIKILGFLSYYGFLINKNTKLAIECFKYLKNWGNDFGSRMLKANNITFEQDSKCVELFDDLVNNLIISKSTINYQIYNILYSNILYIYDKRKLLLSKNADYLTIFNTMPLNIKSSNIDFDLSRLNNLIVKRNDELSSLKKEIKKVNYRTNNSYLPLAIQINSKTIKKDYLNNISKIFTDCVTIDVDNNFNMAELLKFIKKDNNVFIFNLQDDLQQPIINFLTQFLNTDSRSKLDLSGIEINLSSVLPICIGSERIINKFRQITKIVKINDLDNGEKQLMVQTFINKKQNEYKIESLTNNINCYKEINIDNLIIAIDKYLYENKDEKNIILTNDILIDYMKLNSNSYGFGGDLNVYSR